MNASTLAKGLLAATLALTTPGAALALPQTAPVAGASLLQPVAEGCGIGRTRDAMGRCRHRFNLFDHHDRRRFDRYRENHCTAVETPDGRVRRCRI